MVVDRPDRSQREQSGSDGARPDVSVVVVNYRSAALTRRAVEVARRSARDLSVEVVVVDNASGTEEVERLRRDVSGAAVLALPENRGFAAGNNVGIERANGRYLLLLNPDAFAVDDAVARLVGHLEDHPDAGVAAPALENEDGSPQPNLYRHFPSYAWLFVEFCFPLTKVAVRMRRRLTQARHSPRGWLPIAHATGAVLLVRAEAAAATGPLDERYFLYLEETEWQQRMAHAGWRRDGVPTARFVHLGAGSSSTPTLASPHYLDSARVFFGRANAPEATIAAGATLSWLWLSVFSVLGLSSAGEDRLRDAFSELLRLLAARARARVASRRRGGLPERPRARPAFDQDPDLSRHGAEHEQQDGVEG